MGRGVGCGVGGKYVSYMVAFIFPQSFLVVTITII